MLTRSFSYSAYAKLIHLATNTPIDIASVPAGEEPNNFTIFTSSQQELSFVRQYYDNSTRTVYPFLTAIIDVKDGTVQGITWDDACVFCANSRCDENLFDFNGNRVDQEESGQPTACCRIELSECEEAFTSGGDTNPCDIVLYVVWTGTASDGRQFLSSGFRFSAFPKQQITDRIDDLLPEVLQS